MNATYRKRDKVGDATLNTNGRSKGPELAAGNSGSGQAQSEKDQTEGRKEVVRTLRKVVAGEGESTNGKENPDYVQAMELLRSTGTPLLTAVSRYVEAVKILGGDKVIEAARDFARRNSSQRQPRRSRRVADEVIHLIFTPTELMRLLAAAPGWFRPVLAIQAFAGLRCDELLRLDWEDVKLDRGYIEVGTDRSKGAAKRLAPIPPNLVRWLTDAAKSAGKVFPYSRGNFDEIEARTAATAEVGWQEDALRHSFMAYRVALISDVPRVALESGTSAGMIFKRYRALVSEMDARQWFTIGP